VNLLTAAYLVPIVLFSVMRSSDHDSSCSSILHHSIRLEDKKKGKTIQGIQDNFHSLFFIIIAPRGNTTLLIKTKSINIIFLPQMG